ncbi:hypothetical protein [Pseudoalteromonas sp.]|uniref:hypothetical protein n=1 Tax=Pseudoalteromonas sp. TaxID=53249 RepID=UPI00272C84DE|nr:hypothetical protein [Pseudoalteromonas sp.]
MELHNTIKELQSRGLQVLSARIGLSRHIIEVRGKAPAHLPCITENYAGKTRHVRTAKLHNQIILFIEG